MKRELKVLSNHRKKPNDFTMNHKCNFCNDYVDKVAQRFVNALNFNICKGCAQEIINVIDQEYQKEFKTQ